jgi:hypothetical protein
MNTFDRTLWRLIGILLLLGVLGIFSCIIYAFARSSLFSEEEKKEAAVVTTDKKQEKQYLQLRSASILSGTNTLRSSLSKIQSNRSFLKSEYGGSISNFLFMDSANLKSWWLLPDHEGIIQESHDLTTPRHGNNRKVVSSVYEIITEDSNGDGRISLDDNPRLFFSTNQPSSGLDLIAQSTRIIAIEQINDTQAVILFQTSSETRAKTFLISNGATVSEAVISLKH